MVCLDAKVSGVCSVYLDLKDRMVKMVHPDIKVLLEQLDGRDNQDSLVHLVYLHRTELDREIEVSTLLVIRRPMRYRFVLKTLYESGKDSLFYIQWVMDGLTHKILALLVVA